MFGKYDWKDDRILLSSLMRACRLRNDRVLARLPIHLRLLDLLIFEVKRMFRLQPFLSVLYQTLLMFGYYGLMHVGELTQGDHVVLAKDVHMATNKQKILVVLHSSKTHKAESRPQKIKITALQDSKQTKSKSQSMTCFSPFETARHFIRSRGGYKSVNEQFFVFRDRSPVQPQHLRQVLKNALKNMGLDQSLYDVHSLRIGRCTDMMKFGYTIEQIKRAGRWKSNTVYKYIKE